MISFIDQYWKGYGILRYGVSNFLFDKMLCYNTGIIFWRIGHVVLWNAFWPCDYVGMFWYTQDTWTIHFLFEPIPFLQKIIVRKEPPSHLQIGEVNWFFDQNNWRIWNESANLLTQGLTSLDKFDQFQTHFIIHSTYLK